MTGPPPRSLPATTHPAPPRAAGSRPPRSARPSGRPPGGCRDAPSTSTTRSWGRSVSQQRLLAPRAAGVEAGSRSAGWPATAGRPSAGSARACPRPPGPAPAPPTSAPACRGAAARRTGRAPSDSSTRPAEVHHPDPVADVPHHGEVVRDHEVGEAELVLEVLQQVDHLRLDRHVEGADTGSSATIRSGLDATSARAMPIRCRWPPENSWGYLLSAARRQADGRRSARAAGRGCLRLVGVQAVRPHPLDQQRLDGLARVEAGERVLEDHLHPLALRAQLPRP